jgi:putative ATPase
MTPRKDDPKAPGLFEKPRSSTEPLAARMRPRTLDDFIGQENIVGPGRALRRAIEDDAVPSMILFGPPGSGKTTLAEVIAQSTNSDFASLSAVNAGVADLRSVIAGAQKARTLGRKTVLFIDEIHRFNKAQQDAILPYVEDGTITFIGATTENPSFEVNSALLSRSRVFPFNALSEDDLRRIIVNAINDHERGLGEKHLAVDDDALATLISLANGDARVALTTLEFAAGVARADADGVRTITQSLIAEAMQRRVTAYDKKGDNHYAVISAFIKSIRGSDPDAATYWLARMLEAGEDPLFVARRLVILASEDIGLANSQALLVAVAAQQAVHFIGMPEGFYPLAHATLYLATSPKSNSVGRAYGAARTDVEQTINDPVPLNLRNASTNLMQKLGYGQSYRYAHDDYKHLDAPPNLPPSQRLENYLPERLVEREYFKPGSQGDEAKLIPWIASRRSQQETDSDNPFADDLG